MGCVIVQTSYLAKEKRKYFTVAQKGWGFLCFFLYLSRKSWQSSHINEQHHQSMYWQWTEKRGICQTDDILLFSARAWLFIALFCLAKGLSLKMELQRGLCNKSARNRHCFFRNFFIIHLFSSNSCNCNLEYLLILFQSFDIIVINSRVGLGTKL